jgi:hypothetical protein
VKSLKKRRQIAIEEGKRISSNKKGRKKLNSIKIESGLEIKYD